MKNPKYIINALAAILIISLTSCGEKPAHDHSGHDHDHDHAHDHDGHDHGEEGTVVKSVREAGPNGGRILHNVEPHLEFLVMEDRKVKMTALDDSLQPIAMGDQIIRITGGDRANPISLAFVKDGDSLISDKPFPEGDDFPLVVQVTASEGAEKTFSKFTLDMTQCPTCDYLEYACTCDHGDGHDHDHDHKHE